MPENKDTSKKPQPDTNPPKDPGDFLKKGKTPKDWEKRIGKNP